MDLKGKVVIVTGATGILGRGICTVLAGEGMRVVAADLAPARCAALADELVAGGGAALGVAVDVTVKESIARMVAQVLAAYGQIDALINNAGIIEVGAVVDFPEEKWDRVLDVNLKGAFLCAQAVVPGMIERRCGRIVNVSSVAAKRPAPLQSAYASSKHGLLGLTQVWCQELGPHNITVNSVCPGFIESPMWSEHLSPAFAPKFGVAPPDVVETLARAVMPLGRPQQPEDIGQAVAYLCRADNVTGQSMVVDGGLTMY